MPIDRSPPNRSCVATGTRSSEPALGRRRGVVRRALVGSVLVGSALVGCEDPSEGLGFLDAYRITRDVGPIDAARVDAARPDAYGLDASREPPARDGAARDAAEADAGSRFVVDGVLSEPAWEEVTARSTPSLTFGPYAGTEIRRFLVARDARTLSIGFEATLPIETESVVVYAELGASRLGDGVVLQLTGLADRSSELNAILSNGLLAVEGTFRPHLAFGALDRPLRASTGTSRVGWRVLSPSGLHDRGIAQLTACSSDACEATVDLAALAVPASSPIRLVVRVGDAAALDVWVPQQTIPSDPDPEFITASLLVPGVGG